MWSLIPTYAIFVDIHLRNVIKNPNILFAKAFCEHLSDYKNKQMAWSEKKLKSKFKAGLFVYLDLKTCTKVGR